MPGVCRRAGGSDRIEGEQDCSNCAVLPVAERLQMWHMPCSGVCATEEVQGRCLGTLAP